MEPLFYSMSWWEGFTFQHGPHRLGLIHFIFKVIAQLSHWNARVDLFVQASVYVLSTLLALRLKVKLYKRLSYYDVVIPLIFLTPHAASTLYSNPFVHGIVPLFALALCFIYFIQSENIKIITLCIFTFLAAFTGFALVLVPGIMLISVVTMIRVKSTRKLKSALPGIIGLVSLGYILITNVPKPSSETYSFSFQTGLEYALALMGGFFINAPKSGVLIYVGLALLLFIPWALSLFLRARSIIHDSVVRTVLIMFVGVAVFWSVNIFGRAHLAIGNATASRYIPIGMLFALGIYFLLLKLESKLFRTILLSGFVLLTVRMQTHTKHRIRPIALESEAIQSFSQRLQDENQYRQILDDESQLRTIHPHPERIELKEKLEYLKENGLSVFREE